MKLRSLAPAVLALGTLGAGGAERTLERDAESASWTLRLDPEGDTEELPGDEVRRFRVSIAAERATITWRRGDEVFIYEVLGTDPPARALAMVEVLKRQGLESFVADRRPTRRDQTHTRRVWALQINVVL